MQKLALHWGDRYTAAFGPFPPPIQPVRKPHLYERGDVILGCGGYEPARSYLIFSRSRHSADHGADQSGGVFARVVSGRGILDRWTTGDRISKIEPVVNWADTSRSFTTNDMNLVVENGMQIVTRVNVVAQGYTPGRITTEASGSVEHMLLALRSGKFSVSRVTSTHILDSRLAGYLKRSDQNSGTHAGKGPSPFEQKGNWPEVFISTGVMFPAVPFMMW